MNRAMKRHLEFYLSAGAGGRCREQVAVSGLAFGSEEELASVGRQTLNLST